jgi:ferredoxin
LVKKFLEGLKKLFEKENNWTFLQPLVHSMEYCVKCQLCSESCPAYVASGRKEIYRPTFRPELLRRLINKYIKGQGTFLLKLTRSDIELNFTLIARLAELAYRCTLCRGTSGLSRVWTMRWSAGRSESSSAKNWALHPVKFTSRGPFSN